MVFCFSKNIKFSHTGFPCTPCVPNTGADSGVCPGEAGTWLPTPPQPTHSTAPVPTVPHCQRLLPRDGPPRSPGSADTALAPQLSLPDLAVESEAEAPAPPAQLPPLSHEPPGRNGTRFLLPPHAAPTATTGPESAGSQLGPAPRPHPHTTAPTPGTGDRGRHGAAPSTAEPRGYSPCWTWRRPGPAGERSAGGSNCGLRWAPLPQLSRLRLPVPGCPAPLRTGAPGRGARARGVASGGSGLRTANVTFLMFGGLNVHLEQLQELKGFLIIPRGRAEQPLEVKWKGCR